MKAYIAGKITGDPNYREKFKKAQEALELDGFTVINPSILPEGMRPADYMQICIAMIYSADVVAFLPGWRESAGAKLEHSLCDYINKQAIFLEYIEAYRSLTFEREEGAP